MAIWKHKIKCQDFWHNEDMTPAQKLQELSRRLQATFPNWRDDCDVELYDVIQEMSDPPSDVEDCDEILDRMYDWADRERVWIGTF